MPDLVEKFFKKGLTDAEEQQLSDALWASEDTADQFLNNARDAYLRYGWPEPGTPHHPPPSTPGGGIFHWLGLSVLAAGLGAGLYYYVQHHDVLVPAHFTGSSQGVKQAQGKGTAGQQSSKAISSSTSMAPVRDALSPGGRLSSTTRPATGIPLVSVAGQGQGSPVGKPSSPLNTGPINLDQNPAADYSSVSAIVHQSRPGPLAVHVLDTRGLEVASLFDGPLGPGHWVFQWNGKLPNGAQAPAGFYQIEVKVGAYSQRKTVQVH